MERNKQEEWDLQELLRQGGEEWHPENHLVQSCMTAEVGVNDAILKLAELLRIFAEKAFARRLDNLESKIAAMENRIKSQSKALYNPKEGLSPDEIRRRADELRKRKLDFSLIEEDDLKGIV